MLDTIEIAISRAQQINLFQPNNDFTRSQIKAAIDGYLKLVKNAEGINNWLTVCDKSNNPPDQVGNGQLRVDVFIEPTLPAEKIVLRVNITAQGASFATLIANGALG
jgi:phage tail sheath protein FI